MHLELTWELSRILDGATGALVRLDVAELEQIEGRALRLQALLADGLQFRTTPETQARFRVFARVVEGTRDHARILERVAGAARGGTSWPV